MELDAQIFRGGKPTYYIENVLLYEYRVDDHIVESGGSDRFLFPKWDEFTITMDERERT